MCDDQFILVTNLYGKTLFHGQKLDGLVHLACLCEFFKILDVLGQNEIFYVIFG